MLLKRIASLLPPHLSDFIPTLGQYLSLSSNEGRLTHKVEEANIRTTESILFTPPATLQDLLPTIPEAALDDLVVHCLSLTAPRGFSGDELLKSEKNGTWTGFGMDRLDSVFGDSWDGIGVVEIGGMRRIGKSVSYAALWFSCLGQLLYRILLYSSELTCHAATGASCCSATPRLG